MRSSVKGVACSSDRMRGRGIMATPRASSGPSSARLLSHGLEVATPPLALPCYEFVVFVRGLLVCLEPLLPFSAPVAPPDRLPEIGFTACPPSEPSRRTPELLSSCPASVLSRNVPRLTPRISASSWRQTRRCGTTLSGCLGACRLGGNISRFPGSLVGPRACVTPHGPPNP